MPNELARRCRTILLLRVRAQMSKVILDRLLKVPVNFTSGIRKTIRFPLQVPVVFWWADENGTPRRDEGRTRDISESGVFVFAVTCPSLGVSVGLKISLEAIPDSIEIILLEIDGRVVRIEKSDVAGDRSIGFAVLKSAS